VILMAALDAAEYRNSFPLPAGIEPQSTSPYPVAILTELFFCVTNEPK
jgi:hypothetical protein